MARARSKLGERHLEILKFLKEWQSRQGFPPSIREIGEGINVSSTSLTNHYLKQLEADGFISREKRVSRSIRLLKMPGEAAKIKTSGSALRVPLLGRIQAGKPIPIPSFDFSMFDPEGNTVDVPTALLPAKVDGLFALQVQGDSMVDAMVNEGDYVILRQVDAAQNGDMIAAWLKRNEETTLKYFYQENGQVRLQPANRAYEPIFCHPNDLLVQGKAVMVLRTLA